MRVKGKVYTTVVRSAMMYGAETLAVKKAQEKKLDVAEMKMRRWISGVTKLDRIRIERIRGTTKGGIDILERAGKLVEEVWTCIEKRKLICGQNSEGDGGPGEKKERNTEAGVVG